MLRSFLIILTLLSTPFFADVITLKDKLSEAVPHSYLVTEQSRNFTFLRIFEKKGDRITLEEVTIPAENFTSHKMGWREWFEKGAAGHTSWMLSRINLQTGTIEEVYSCTCEGWVDAGHYTSFITTLLNLHFHPLAEVERRHIGLPPGYGKPDLRPLWHPRLVVEGQACKGVFFQAWKARWPADGSELSRKTVEVYLPLPNPSLPTFPGYFPYWLEVEGKIGSAKIRVIDSGMEARSIRTHFPLRKPTLINQGKWEEDHYVVTLKNPSHITDFMVVAEECNSPLCKSFPLPNSIHQLGDVTKLLIKEEDLSNSLSCDERYRLVITTNEGPFALLETESSQILVSKKSF